MSRFFTTKKCRFLSLVLLATSLLTAAPFSVYAFEKIDFTDFVEQVEQTQKSAPAKADKMLKDFQPHLTEYTLAERIKFYLISAELSNTMGLFEAGKQHANAGLELAKQQISPSAIIAELLYSRGYAYESLGDNKSAMKDYKKGVQLAKSLNHIENSAYGYVNIGALQYLARQFQASLLSLNKARSIADKSDDYELKGYVYGELGILYSYIEEAELSLQYYKQSYESFEQAGAVVFAANAKVNSGTALMDLGRYEEAIEILKGVLESTSDVLSDRSLYLVNTRLATCYTDKENPNYELAYQYLLNAGKYVQGTDAHELPVFYLVERAELLYQLERYDEVDSVLMEVKGKIGSMSKNSQLYMNSSYHSILARSQYKREQYKSALENQKVFHQVIMSRFEQQQQAEIADIRMRFESEQADVTNQILEEQKAIKTLALAKAKASSDWQWLVSLAMCIVALVVAWGLVKLIQGQKVLKLATITDPLTGVANRYQLLQMGQQLINTKTPFSLLIIDIDHFKQINDKKGHSVGDKVIQRIAELGVRSMRSTDTFGRLGGEEFMVILPNTSIIQAHDTAERLLKEIKNYSWSENLNLEPVTASVGVAEFNKHTDTSLEDIAKIADERLYEAKQQGRNRVCSQCA